MDHRVVGRLRMADDTIRLVDTRAHLQPGGMVSFHVAELGYFSFTFTLAHIPTLRNHTTPRAIPVAAPKGVKGLLRADFYMAEQAILITGPDREPRPWSKLKQPVPVAEDEATQHDETRLFYFFPSKRFQDLVAKVYD